MALAGISSPYGFRQGEANPFIHYAGVAASGHGKPLHQGEELFDLQNIKEQWVRKELEEREDQFSEYHEVTILIGTWNVNSRLPSESLKPWLECDGDPELIAIGFQELDLSAEAFLVTDTYREVEWTKMIISGIEASHAARYTKVASKQLVGMLLIVLVRNDCLEHITGVAADYAGCGIMGMMGNKGGVAICIRYRDSYLCFVNSHLAADTNQVERRNQDFIDICRRINFSKPSAVVTLSPAKANKIASAPVAGASTGAVAAPARRQLQAVGATAGTTAQAVLVSGGVAGKCNTVFDADHLFWLGDLNYRVPLPEAEVKAAIDNGDLNNLLKLEQLTVEMQANRVFAEFCEGKITFPPTYKFDVGTSTYDSSEKRRAPSWCDRILWKSKSRRRLRKKAAKDGGLSPEGRDNLAINSNSDAGDVGQCRVMFYRSHMGMVTSDHKPVSTFLRCNVRSILPAKQQEVYATIIRELDKFENELQPIASISTSKIDFGFVQYLQPKIRTLTIENVGKVLSQFRFIQLDQAGRELAAYANGLGGSAGHPASATPEAGSSVGKSWMFIEPSAGMLVPGEKAQIQFTVLIDGAAAETLNIAPAAQPVAPGSEAEPSGFPKACPALDDTLILHLENGKDFFLEVTGRFRRTCFALSLERLVRLDRPVRLIGGSEWRTDGLSTTVSPTAVPQQTQIKSIPTELWRMVDFLWKFAMDTDELFILSGDQAIIAYIRECLDTGDDFDHNILLNDAAVGKLQAAEVADLRSPSRAFGLDALDQSVPLNDDPLENAVPDTPDAPVPETMLPKPPQPPTSATYLAGDEELASEGSESGEEHLGIHSMAEALLRFLEALPEPVIPFAVQPRCLEAASILGPTGYDGCKACLAYLPTAHFNVFLYVISFLKEVLKSERKRRRRRRRLEEERRKRSSGREAEDAEVSATPAVVNDALEVTMMAKKFAVIFSSILLRPRVPPSPGDRFAESSARKARIFLTHFMKLDDADDADYDDDDEGDDDDVDEGDEDDEEEDLGG